MRDWQNLEIQSGIPGGKNRVYMYVSIESWRAAYTCACIAGLYVYPRLFQDREIITRPWWPCSAMRSAIPLVLVAVKECSCTHQSYRFWTRCTTRLTRQTVAGLVTGLAESLPRGTGIPSTSAYVDGLCAYGTPTSKRVTLHNVNRCLSEVSSTTRVSAFTQSEKT